MNRHERDLLDAIHEAAVSLAIDLHEAEAGESARRASLLVDLIVTLREIDPDLESPF